MNLTPLIRWAGGKSWLKPLFQKWRDTGRVKFDGIVEMFAGGAAISFGLDLERVWLNDINLGLCMFYNYVQKCPPRPAPRIKEKDYYHIREVYNSMMLCAEAPLRIQENMDLVPWFDYSVGELFYYLNRTCFNGLYRENKRGEYNVPYGFLAKPTLKWSDILYIPKMEGWKITSQDWPNFIPVNNDLIFADPPYIGTFAAYAGKSMDWGFDTQVALAKYLAQLHAVFGAPVVATNAWNEKLVSVYRDLGFFVSKERAPRRIAANGNRDKAFEMLATTFPASIEHELANKV